jgi:uncharacterized membrane protein
LNAPCPISRNAAQEFHNNLTLGQQPADRIAVFHGSWTFVLVFRGVLLAWVVLNTLALTRFDGVFEPTRFFLNLIRTMLAGLQAPVIMMSQNGHAVQDRVGSKQDQEVNLKAELEILVLHQKVDTLREQQWLGLVAMQREQIALLTGLVNSPPIALQPT